VSLRSRLAAVGRAAAKRAVAPRHPGVCDRIEELTARYAADPPAVAPEIDAAIRAAVARETGPDGEGG